MSAVLVATNEQRHFYANKPKTEMRHFRLKHYKTRCTPVKRDRYKIQGMVSIQNEIRIVSRTKNKPKEEVLGDGYPADIRGSFARMSRPITSVRALKILEKQAFGRGYP